MVLVLQLCGLMIDVDLFIRDDGWDAWQWLAR
jgi:hypothetical protein